MLVPTVAERTGAGQTLQYTAAGAMAGANGTVDGLQRKDEVGTRVGHAESSPTDEGGLDGKRSAPWGFIAPR